MGIVADDLTGALDVSAAFAVSGLKVVASVSTLTRPVIPAAVDVICRNTQTRHFSETASLDQVRNATRQLLDEGCLRLYKKVDSTLRGHVGVEICAMLRESPAPFALISPAFPSMGRTLRDGILYVWDEPVTQSA